MDDNEYESAWKEGEDADNEPAPATKALKAAKAAADESEQGEFIKAYTDLDEKEQDEKKDEKSDDSKKKQEADDE